MTYTDIKQVLDVAGVSPLVTYSESGMWFTPVASDNWEGHADTPVPLKVDEVTVIKEIPPSVFTKPGQLEAYKSNMIVEIATKIIAAIFNDTTEIDKTAMLSYIKNATTAATVTDALDANDILMTYGLPGQLKYFNSAKAAELDYSENTHGTVFDRYVKIGAVDPTNKVVGFLATPGAYMLYISDIEWEEEHERSTNIKRLRATVYVQGMPTMPAVSANLA